MKGAPKQGNLQSDLSLFEHLIYDILNVRDIRTKTFNSIFMNSSCKFQLISSFCWLLQISSPSCNDPNNFIVAQLAQWKVRESPEWTQTIGSQMFRASIGIWKSKQTSQFSKIFQVFYVQKRAKFCCFFTGKKLFIDRCYLPLCASRKQNSSRNFIGNIKRDLIDLWFQQNMIWENMNDFLFSFFLFSQISHLPEWHKLNLTDNGDSTIAIISISHEMISKTSNQNAIWWVKRNLFWSCYSIWPY